MKYYQVFKEGLLLGKVSLERAAEVFETDVASMQEIKSRWIEMSTSQDGQPFTS